MQNQPLDINSGYPTWNQHRRSNRGTRRKAGTRRKTRGADARWNSAPGDAAPGQSVKTFRPVPHRREPRPPPEGCPVGSPPPPAPAHAPGPAEEPRPHEVPRPESLPRRAPGGESERARGLWGCVFRRFVLRGSEKEPRWFSKLDIMGAGLRCNLLNVGGGPGGFPSPPTPEEPGFRASSEGWRVGRCASPPGAYGGLASERPQPLPLGCPSLRQFWGPPPSPQREWFLRSL